MYLRDVAARGFALSGIRSFTPDANGGADNRRGIVPGDLDAMAVCISAAMQEIFDVGPASLSERDDGALLFAPVTVPINVTNGLTAISFPVSSGTFMLTDVNNSQSTSAIAYNASAATVQASVRLGLDASLNAATVTGPNGGPWVISGASATVLAGSATNGTISVSPSTSSTSFTVTLSMLPNLPVTGCTIRIAGDAYDNEVLSPNLLVRPTMAPTGLTTAVIFGDVIQMGSTIKNVMDPISIPSFPPMYLCSSREEFDQFPFGNMRIGFQRRTQFSPPWGYGYSDSAFIGPTFQPKQTGIPRAAFSDTRFDATLAYVPIYLRLTPMPIDQRPIRYRVKLKAPTYTAAQIDDGAGNSPGNAIIPQDMLEAGLVAIVCNRWMGQPSVVISDRQAAEITREYTAAIQALRGTRPQIGCVTAIYE